MSTVWLVYQGEHEGRYVARACATKALAEAEWRNLQRPQIEHWRGYYALRGKDTTNRVRELEAALPDIEEIELLGS